MGLLRTAAIVVLVISFFTFIALFGRLPTFRRTPIGFLYRSVWIYIPNGFVRIDSAIFGGRILSCFQRSRKYLMFENHPLVLIFFILLQLGGEILFVPAAWPDLGTLHRFLVPIAVVLPYVFLYAGVVTKSTITADNVDGELTRYPFDRVLFHPGHKCRTCLIPKPARSKHCSLCNACVARHDHHCIWLNNCVGRDNHRYFLCLLLSVSIMLMYGVYLGYSILDGTLQKHFLVRSSPSQHWSRGKDWGTYVNLWALVIADNVRLGVTFLLAAMTAPLAISFLCYHLYLIWAGMTTNETAKWDDWKADIAERLVFKSKKSRIYGQSQRRSDGGVPKSSWPATSDQILILTDGEPPRAGFMLDSLSNFIAQPKDENACIDQRWDQVRSLREIENVYDLGFWGNLCDALGLPINEIYS